MRLAARDGGELSQSSAPLFSALQGQGLRAVLALLVFGAAGTAVGAKERATAPLSTSPVPGPGFAVITMTFREECWTEVRDGTGNRLFRDLAQAGRRLRLEGIPPFELFLGNAGGVDIAYGGRKADTRRYASGEVGRIRLGAPGPVPLRADPEPTASPRVSVWEVQARAEPPAFNAPVLDPAAVREAKSRTDSQARVTPAPETGEEPAGSRGVDRLAAWDRTYDPERWFDDVPADREARVPAEEQPAAEDREDGEKEVTVYPRLVGMTDVRVEYNSRFRAEDTNDEFDDWLSFVDSSFVYDMSPQWRLKSRIRGVLEGEDDGLHRFNTDFPYEGLYVEELRLQHDRERYAIFGGKYIPAGSIFGYAPIFFGNYATDLDLEERVGLGASLFLQRRADSEIAITAHLFFLDTSALSGEIYGGGARNSGGPGDTGTLNNYLMTFNGGSTGWNPGLRYTLGAGMQQGDQPRRDESARLGSLFHVTRLVNGADVELSLDLLSLENAGGEAIDTDSVTLGAAYSDWPFLLGIAHSERSVEPVGQTDRIIELVFRKGIAKSLYFELAYQHVDESDQEEESFGATLVYSLDWPGR